LNSPWRASCVVGELWRPLNSLKQKRISPVEEERSGLDTVEAAVELVVEVAMAVAAVAAVAAAGAAAAEEEEVAEAVEAPGRETSTVVGDR